MKEKKIKKRIASVLKAYLLYAVLTAILVPLPQKEASGTLRQQYEARLDTAAARKARAVRGFELCAASRAAFVVKKWPRRRKYHK